jgi:hypothetical protein
MNVKKQTTNNTIGICLTLFNPIILFVVFLSFQKPMFNLFTICLSVWLITITYITAIRK